MLVYSLPTYLKLYVVSTVVLEVTINFYLAAVLLLVYRPTVYFIALSVVVVVPSLYTLGSLNFFLSCALWVVVGVACGKCILIQTSTSKRSV
jgi:hypothetical protein